MVRLVGLVALAGLLVGGCGEKQDPIGPGADIEGEVTYGEHIMPILDANCISCHAADKQGAARNGAPVGVDCDSYEDAAASADRANAQIQSGAMPVGGELSDLERSLFQAWVDQGTPE